MECVIIATYQAEKRMSQDRQTGNSCHMNNTFLSITKPLKLLSNDLSLMLQRVQGHPSTTPDPRLSFKGHTPPKTGNHFLDLEKL